MTRVCLLFLTLMCSLVAFAQVPRQEELLRDLEDGTSYGLRLVGFQSGDHVSGTKVEFNVEAPAAAGWQVRDIWLHDLTIELDGEEIESDPQYLYGGNDVQRSFRFSSLKWNHNTNVPIVIRANFEYLLIGFGIVSDIVELTVTPKAWNVLGTSITNRDSSGNSSLFYEFAGDKAWTATSHFGQFSKSPATRSGASGHTITGLYNNIVLSSVYLFQLHGDPAGVNAPNPQPGWEENLKWKVWHSDSDYCVSDAILAKSLTNPALTIVLAYSCSTLGAGSDAIQGWHLGGKANHAYFGFSDDVSMDAMTKASKLAYEQEKDAHAGEHIIPSSFLVAQVGDHAKAISKGMAVDGKTAEEALEYANSEIFCVKGSFSAFDSSADPQFISMSLDSGTDGLSTLKYVYLTSAQRSALAVQEKSPNIYWIRL